MSAKIVQLNFNLNISGAEWKETAASLAQAFADLPGLQWKLWMLNEETGEAGGIYLFEDETARQGFLNGPLAAQVKAAPFLRDLSIKQFEVMEEVSEITRAPFRVAPARAGA